MNKYKNILIEEFFEVFLKNKENTVQNMELIELKKLLFWKLIKEMGYELDIDNYLYYPNIFNFFTKEKSITINFMFNDYFLKIIIDNIDDNNIYNVILKIDDFISLNSKLTKIENFLNKDDFKFGIDDFKKFKDYMFNEINVLISNYKKEKEKTIKIQEETKNNLLLFFNKNILGIYKCKEKFKLPKLTDDEKIIENEFITINKDEIFKQIKDVFTEPELKLINLKDKDFYLIITKENLDKYFEKISFDC